MGKELSEMTLEELWELFPIFLAAHNDRWKDSFHEIEKTLTEPLFYKTYLIKHMNCESARLGFFSKPRDELFFGRLITGKDEGSSYDNSVMSVSSI